MKPSARRMAILNDLLNATLGRAQSNKDLTRDLFVKHGCVNAKVYTNTFNLLQRVLGATRKVDLQHLVMQFGCTSCRCMG
jgi:hypothetical protein